MNILVWGINYAPEVVGIAPFNAALCEYLAARGHNVTMLTTFAYYPQWKKRQEDAGRMFGRETANGVKVVRVWHYVPRRVGAIARIVHEASFLATSFLYAVFMGRMNVAVVVSPPLGLGAVAWLYSKLKNVPFVFHVQDLQPDAAVSLGMLKPSNFTKLLYKLEALAYRKAAKVSGISKGMIEAFASKGVPAEKILSFPNGVRQPTPESFPPRGVFRQRWNIDPNVCLATYSGNLGAKQGLDILIDVAEKLADRPFHIVISGDGVRREELQNRLVQKKLKNVLSLPLQDDLAYREMLVDTSVSLITQQRGTGKYFFPSKLLTVLIHSNPVIAVADEDSELAVAVRKAECGVVVAPEDVDGLATALLTLSDPARLETMGRNGKKWIAQFAFEIVQGNFETELIKLARRHE